MTLSLKPGSALRDAPRCSADELRALLRRGHLTGSAAGAICGVNPRTIRRWIGGDSEIPYSAWSLIQTHVDRVEMITDATADHAAWISEMDQPQPWEEQFAVLRAIRDMQHQRVCELEDELAEARRILGDTNRQMNQAAAQKRLDTY